MLVFVIPLKSQEVSKSWPHVCQLLERCIRSVCNQTSPEFRVIVVCHQKPEIEFEHPNLTFIKVDFPIPQDKNSIAKGLTDKGRKVLAGLTHARQFNPTYALSVDADDCVSKHLVNFVKQSPQANGWFIDKGYKYIEGSDYIYIKRRNFYRMSGTSNIIRYNLLDLPEKPKYNLGYGSYKFHLDHEKVRDFMKLKGKPIQALPFAGGVYVLGSENMSGNDSKLSFNFFNRQKLTSTLRDEFSLYSIKFSD